MAAIVMEKGNYDEREIEIFQRNRFFYTRNGYAQTHSCVIALTGGYASAILELWA